MTCSICGSIPDLVRANTGRDEYFRPPVTSLTSNGIESRDDLWECPECHAVFHWHDDTAQSGSGNNDEEVLARLPREQAPFLHAFLHRGERTVEDTAQDAPRLVDVPAEARALVLTHVRHRDPALAAGLVPWMLDQITHSDRRWAVTFLEGVATGEGAAQVMSELALRPPSPAADLLRAHCKRALCSICRPIVTYRATMTRREPPLPSPLSALVQLRASDELDLWECPECDSIFLWESRDGIEGSLIRKSEPLAAALRACVHRKEVVRPADADLVFACAMSKVVVVYGMRHDHELVRQLVPQMVSSLVRFDPPWLYEILCTFVEAEPRNAQAVLTALESAPRRNPHAETISRLCRGQRNDA